MAIDLPSGSFGTDPLPAEATVELLHKARQGDEGALNRLLERCIPALRRWARGRMPAAARNGLETADLVQDAVLRALGAAQQFTPGTNFKAWIFTILRNLFRSEYRKRRREVEDAEGRYADTLKSQPEQMGRVEFGEFRSALGKLPSDQREALILVGASGFSYEDAATICGCAVGTIKSRVNRARTRLAELLSINSADDFGPDRATRAVLAGGGCN